MWCTYCGGVADCLRRVGVRFTRGIVGSVDLYGVDQLVCSFIAVMVLLCRYGVGARVG